MSIGEVLLPSISEATYDAVHNVGRTLIDAAAQMTRAVDRRAQTVGITGAQWVVLIRIGGGIGSTASELCRTLGYDSGAMTRMLDRLVKLGLVRRVPSPADGRVMTVALTPAGEALYPRLRPIAIDVLNTHLRGFKPEEIEQLMGFLERIIANGQAGSDGVSCDTGPAFGGATRSRAGGQQ
ncbi:UNVERIFIED_ORG: DNA-binding MarR family transcriptional regulator [Xanthobacter viscosus]|nr:MarR family winged helix-turn-helix transcriptional regulator [Xanthobacter autotrophicus]